jgi:hypothetical protein
MLGLHPSAWLGWCLLVEFACLRVRGLWVGLALLAWLLADPSSASVPLVPGYDLHYLLALSDLSLLTPLVLSLLPGLPLGFLSAFPPVLCLLLVVLAYETLDSSPLDEPANLRREDLSRFGLAGDLSVGFGADFSALAIPLG